MTRSIPELMADLFQAIATWALNRRDAWRKKLPGAEPEKGEDSKMQLAIRFGDD